MGEHEPFSVVMYLVIFFHVGPHILENTGLTTYIDANSYSNPLLKI